jgi:hypothetical protein
MTTQPRTAPTAPIAPQAKPGTPAPTTPSPTSSQGRSPTTANPAPAPTANAPVKNQPRSTIDRQLRSATRPAYYAPLEITFLTGTLKGETLDLNPGGRSLLGLGVNEVDQSQQANWPDRSEKGIRVGSQFDGVSARTFRLSIEYWSDREDVSQLVENLFLLQEIQPDTSTPPTLLVRQGKIEADPCVCTEISPKYDKPLPGGIAGYRHAKVELSFKLLGGVVSQHSLARPLGPSILQDLRQDESQADRDRKGEAAVVERLLHPCLKDEAAKVEEMILKNQLTPSGLSSLTPNARVQLAIAGKIPGDTLKDPAFADRLKEDLALTIAQNEDGVGKSTAQTRLFSQAIATGSADGLPPSLAPALPSARSTYDETLSAITSGNWDNKSPLFSQPELTRRLQNFGSCGLRLRAKGAEPAKGDGQASGAPSSQQGTLNQINRAIATKSDDELKTLFGFKNNTDVRQLRSGAPYTGQQQFLDRLTKANSSIAAVDAWKNAEAAFAKEAEKPENT